MAPLTPKKAYNQKYAKENFKRIPLDVQKTFYEKIKEMADKKGMPVNTYVKEAIIEKIEREETP